MDIPAHHRATGQPIKRGQYVYRLSICGRRIPERYASDTGHVDCKLCLKSLNARVLRLYDNALSKQPIYPSSTLKDKSSRKPKGYTRGDPAPLIRSINQASDILRRRGYNIDSYVEMPRSGDQNYYNVLVHLKNTLWAKVKATAPKTTKRTRKDKMGTPHLKLDYIVRIDHNKRSSKDHRRKVNWVLCSYRDSHGDEYRRAFEHPVNTSDEVMRARVPRTLN